VARGNRFRLNFGCVQPSSPGSIVGGPARDGGPMRDGGPGAPGG
jgi:hypothetical protein